MQPDPHHDRSALESSDIDRARQTSLPFGQPARVPLEGIIAFASPEAQVQRTAELLGAGAMVVIVAPPSASVRGRLAEHLDDLIERELGARGAPSPYLTEWSAMPDDSDARLADQLFRARTVGATGIAVAMGSIAWIGAPALDVADCTTLRALAKATESAPLVVLMDDGDAQLAAYAPVALEAMVGVKSASAAARTHAEAFAQAEPEALIHVEPEPLELVETHVDAAVAEIARVDAHGERELDTADEHEEEPLAAPVEHEEEPLAAPVEREEEPLAAPVVQVARTDAREAARRRATAGVPVAGPSDFWRSWAIALGAARGPQQLATFERLFTESYMPLANAIAGGVEDPRALRAHDEFQRGFERSYTDAFATFGATGRRPRLVMDAFDIASKQARLHNARTTHVLVVDAMRHDLGGLVRDAIAARAPGVASLTSESVLWSALPTTTFRQLETLARGMDALRAPAPEEGAESLRGRSAETVRRLRVGSRELYKLDLIPSMLAGIAEPTAGGTHAGIVNALEAIAGNVADAIVRHVATLRPRTLLLVLGDHGFTIDRRGRVTHGGATPEEVIVPCLAYLVGEVH